MRKINLFVLFSVAAFFVAHCWADDDNAVTLVYPMTAAQTELDDSTPAKRTTPPVREADEYDPVTPIGQIRGIVETLNKLETQSDALVETVGKLQIDDKGILPILERGARNQDAIGTNVENLLESSKGIAAKIDALQKTTADLRATVESVEKTAASIERIRTSRWTDYAVIAILTLVLIQVVWRVGGTIYNGLKARAERWRVMVAAYEAQVANEKNETK